MTTPNGQPSQAKPLRYRDEPGDAAVQAGANKSEATVRSTNQDVSRTGRADVSSGLPKLKGGVANEQGQPFTGSV